MHSKFPFKQISKTGKVQGGRQRNPHMTEGKIIPYLRVANVFDGFIDLSDVNEMLFKPNEIIRFRLRRGDILLNEGQSIELVGRCAMYQTGPENCCYQNTLLRYRAGPDTNSKFALQLFRYCQSGGIFSRIAVKTNSIAHLGVSRFAELELPFPPLPEQRKIAEILATWDEAIDACERLICAKETRLSEVKRKLYSATRPGDDADFVGEWQGTTLGDLFIEISDPNPGLGAENVITVGKYAIRPQIEHFTRSVASSNLSKYQLLNPGDFVYDPMSAYYGAIGKYSGSDPGIVSPAYRVIRLNEGNSPAYVAGLLKSHYVAFELERRSSQGNREGKRRILRRDEFAAIRLKLPPNAEQRRIAEIISEVTRELDLTLQVRDALTKQKRGLMQKLLTGEWRVAIEEEAAT